MKLAKIFLRPILHFFALYFTNCIISNFPIRFVRMFWYKFFVRMKIEKHTFIDMHQYFFQPWKIQIGKFSHINRGCFLDGRGGIHIGNSVCISHKVSLVTGGHDMNSGNFEHKFLPIYVGNYVFIGVGAIVLGNVRIGDGCVVCAGAVVTKDCDAYGIYAGVPARKIGERSKNLNYTCNPKTFFC